MRETGLEEVEMYTTWKYNTVSQYIETQQILELYEEVDQCLGVWVSKRWQKQ